MRVTSTGADFSARAARRPPKPPPMMTTRCRSAIGALLLRRRERRIRRGPLRRGDALTKLGVTRLRRNAVALCLPTEGGGDVNGDIPQLRQGGQQRRRRVGERRDFSPSARAAARTIASVTRRAREAMRPSPLAGKI